MSVRLDQVIPWGRSFDEYRRMFDLSSADLRGRILGCGDGPASFNVEASMPGGRVTSCDPIYSLRGDVIRRRFDECAGPLMAQVRATPEHYVWTVHRGPDDLLRNRRLAMEAFLADYESAKRRGRYVAAALPALPFADGAFDLAVVSHLLFLYSDLLDRAFHEQAIRELCRVAREVRIFPLVSLNCAPSPHVEPVCAALVQDGFDVEIRRVDYEFVRGANQMMRVCAGGSSRR
jgi:SAM-dependent methyltransferase